VRRRAFLKGLLAVGAITVSPWWTAGCLERTGADPPLSEKIGQMLMVGFRGLEIARDGPIARDILRYGIGGVVLFDYDVTLRSPIRNIVDGDQLTALTSQLQGMSPVPLLIAVDQEGGRVARLKDKHGFPETLSALRLGAVDDPRLTRREAEKTAATLHAHGINLNFAPVVDLNSNSENPVIGRLERSFSYDPQTVATHAEEVVRAHDRHKVLTCLKHFPGHGSSSADSHQGFVDVTGTWRDSELAPYRRLIGQGLARMVMTAHIFNRRLDPLYPATLSESVITGILRQSLGFDGVVISDDLQMGAISQNFLFDVAVQKAVQAGVDILLVANNMHYDPDVTPKMVERITRLAKKGVIPQERIDSSYRRIMALKARLAAEANRQAGIQNLAASRGGFGSSLTG